MIDYQINELKKLGYEKQPEAMDFVKETEYARARFSIGWSYNPDKMTYFSAVWAIHDGAKIATWQSEQSFKFHTTLRETEETLKFVGDIMQKIIVGDILKQVP